MLPFLVSMLVLPMLSGGLTTDAPPVWVQARTGNGPPFSVAPTANDIDHLKKAIKAEMTPDLDGIAAPKLTIYAPVEAHGDVEVVLPGGVKKKYKKVAEPDTALKANTAKTPYLFELPASAVVNSESHAALWTTVAVVAGVLPFVAVLVYFARPTNTLQRTLLVAFKKRSTNLEHLQVYDCPNMMCPVVANKWFAVRKEYDLVFEKFQAVAKEKGEGSTRRCLLILGNSGIGKSVGLDDLLRRVLDDVNFQFLVIVVVAARGDYILFRNGLHDSWAAYSCEHKDTRQSVDALLKKISGRDADKKVLLLHDVKSTLRAELRFDYSFAAHLRSDIHLTLVVAASPNELNYRSVRDEFPGRTEWWSTCWGIDEAKELWTLNNNDAAAFDEAFFNMGGVPRHLLNDSSQYFFSEVEKKLGDLTYEQLHQAVGNNTAHCIAMAVPSNNRAVMEMCTFVSKGAEVLWRRKGKQVKVQDIRNHYAKSVAENLPGGVQGGFFERLILALLLQRPAHVLELYDVVSKGAKAGTKWKKSSETIDVGALAAEEVPFSGCDATNVTKQGVPTVFVPQNQQFPFVDFLIVYPSGEVTGIQSTVNQRHHRPTPSTVRKVLEPLTSNHLTMTKLVWALPRTGKCWKWQELDDPDDKASKALLDKYNSIRQYVLLE